MAMTLAPAPRGAAKIRGERNPFANSDDNAMMKQILATHAPDGRQMPVGSLLHVVEDIFQRAHFGLGTIAHQGTHAQQMDALEDKAVETGLDEMLEVLSHTISKISCEISCKCSGGGDAHATTVTIFNSVTSYNWDVKVVLALAAFAVNYGEFWLVAQLYLTNPLAKAVAFLKQLPEILERADALKPKFDALNNLIKAMLDVATCIVEFNELPPQYITADTPEMVAATAHIPTAAYWTIRSIVACESQIRGLLGMGHEYIASTTEAWELSSLAHKVSNIHKHLMEKLAECYRHIDEKRHTEAYQLLVRLMETPHIDNIKILKALIYAKDDQLPLFDGSTKRRASIDVLRRKNVLLFISDLDLSHDELFILEQMYQEARQNPSRAESMYDVVWLPVVERSVAWDETKQKQFETLQQMMPWFSVYHPSLLDPAVIRYIKEHWHFIKKPLLVVIDSQGKVVNQNAIHMIWIWGSQAFPFTRQREETLWKEETWRIDLLADTIDPAIFNWIAENKYICLYGGEDIEWIRKFTRNAQAVAREAQISLEMLYVGKSNPREKVRKNNAIIQAEKLSHVLQDITLVWFFWVRIESMWHSKVQHGKSVENDQIMQEIMTMLSFDGSEQGWAVISRGSAEMARAKGETISEALVDYEKWKNPEKGFVNALNDHLHDVHTDHHCNRLILPGVTGGIPERVVCAECGRPMEKFIMYRCCTD
ncbi:protein SIEVE ELEMENT OCCLUSION B-like [Tripterygium wilfordii]|uniref:protein SIEVE ELEMENT OCCLUSION B-like n=1 Tax=Tripterygium wilfordii TaxID=458696 RepID=UPI0018F7EEF8|nr:protein SIEVE ELEMENT OCCLUSION B-like [Tripterygium wilfordii]